MAKNKIPENIIIGGETIETKGRLLKEIADDIYTAVSKPTLAKLRTIGRGEDIIEAEDINKEARAKGNSTLDKFREELDKIAPLADSKKASESDIKKLGKLAKNFYETLSALSIVEMPEKRAGDLGAAGGAPEQADKKAPASAGAMKKPRGWVVKSKAEELKLEPVPQAPVESEAEPLKPEPAQPVAAEAGPAEAAKAEVDEAKKENNRGLINEVVGLYKRYKKITDSALHNNNIDREQREELNKVFLSSQPIYAKLEKLNLNTDNNLSDEDKQYLELIKNRWQLNIKNITETIKSAKSRKMEEAKKLRENRSGATNGKAAPVEEVAARVEESVEVQQQAQEKQVGILKQIKEVNGEIYDLYTTLEDEKGESPEFYTPERLKDINSLYSQHDILEKRKDDKDNLGETLLNDYMNFKDEYKRQIVELIQIRERAEAEASAEKPPSADEREKEILKIGEETIETLNKTLEEIANEFIAVANKEVERVRNNGILFLEARRKGGDDKEIFRAEKEIKAVGERLERLVNSINNELNAIPDRMSKGEKIEKIFKDIADNFSKALLESESIIYNLQELAEVEPEKPDRAEEEEIKKEKLNEISKEVNNLFRERWSISDALPLSLRDNLIRENNQLHDEYEALNNKARAGDANILNDFINLRDRLAENILNCKELMARFAEGNLETLERAEIFGGPKNYQEHLEKYARLAELEAKGANRNKTSIFGKSKFAEWDELRLSLTADLMNAQLRLSGGRDYKIGNQKIRDFLDSGPDNLKIEPSDSPEECLVKIAAVIKHRNFYRRQAENQPDNLEFNKLVGVWESVIYELTRQYNEMFKPDPPVNFNNLIINDFKAELEKLRGEEKVTKRSPEEAWSEEFGLSKEGLASLGFYSQEISDGQRQLIMSNLRQLTLGRIEEEALKKYKTNLTENKFLGRIWQGITKKYQIAKLEKSNAQKIIGSGMGAHQEILKQLIDGAKLGPDAEIIDGQLDIKYNSEIGNTAESQKIIDEFNAAATEFSKIPYEWSLDGASQQERNKYNKAKDNYEKVKQSILEMKKQDVGEKEAMIFMNDIDGKVNLNRFLNANPDVEERLKKVKNQKAWAQVIKDIAAERGLYFAAGFAARSVTMSLIGFAGMPLAAAGLGGYMSFKRGKEGLMEKDVMARKGEADTSKEAKNVVKAVDLEKKETEERGLIEKMEGLMNRIDAENDGEKRKKLIDFLKTRISYTEGKIEKGLVDFGASQERLANQYKLITIINRAKAYLNLDNQAKTVLEERLEIFLNFREEKISKARKKYLIKQTLKGATLGAGFALAGYGIRHIVGEWLGWGKGSSAQQLKTGDKNFTGRVPSDLSKTAPAVGEVKTAPGFNEVPSGRQSGGAQITEQGAPKLGPATAGSEGLAVKGAEAPDSPVSAPESEIEEISESSFVGKGKGIEHAFINQLKEDPKKFKFDGDADDTGAVRKWAETKAHQFADKLGYVEKVKGGTMNEIRISAPDKSAYVLNVDDQGNITVDNYAEGKIKGEYNFQETRQVEVGSKLAFKGNELGENEYLHKGAKPRMVAPEEQPAPASSERVEVPVAEVPEVNKGPEIFNPEPGIYTGEYIKNLEKLVGSKPITAETGHVGKNMLNLSPEFINETGIEIDAEGHLSALDKDKIEFVLDHKELFAERGQAKMIMNEIVNSQDRLNNLKAHPELLDKNDLAGTKNVLDYVDNGNKADNFDKETFAKMLKQDLNTKQKLGYLKLFSKESGNKWEGVKEMFSDRVIGQGTKVIVDGNGLYEIKDAYGQKGISILISEGKIGIKTKGSYDLGPWSVNSTTKLPQANLQAGLISGTENMVKRVAKSMNESLLDKFVNYFKK